MALVFRELHKAKSPDKLNEEWLLLENTGPNVVTAQKVDLTVARRAADRPHPLGTLDPGFILQPNQKIRLVTGTPSKKAAMASLAASASFRVLLSARAVTTRLGATSGAGKAWSRRATPRVICR